MSVACQYFNQVVVEGRDLEGLPFAFLKSVEFKAGGQSVGKVAFNPGTPFQCLLPDKTRRVIVTLEFQAHYGEPPLDIPVTVTPRRGVKSACVATPTVTSGWVESVCVATPTACHNTMIVCCVQILN